VSQDWDASRYDADLARGLDLSGEGADYFAEWRVRRVREMCERRGLRPGRVVEFGCGTGNNLRFLAASFPDAAILGLDASEEMLEAARLRTDLPSVELAHSDVAPFDGAADLVFVNGVFHHIPLRDRLEALRGIRGYLQPNGLLALFENNPLNPGAMWVMRRIPFDRNAQPVGAGDLTRLAHRADLERVALRSYFYYPRPLRFLRFTEPWLAYLPLGAQYVLYATPSRS
jgi:trans-aconitate methyltransferase